MACQADKLSIRLVERVHVGVAIAPHAERNGSAPT
jgi:hypothetical protein